MHIPTNQTLASINSNLMIDGEVKSLKDWSIHFGVSPDTMLYRWQAGYRDPQILSHQGNIRKLLDELTTPVVKEVAELPPSKQNKTKITVPHKNLINKNASESAPKFKRPDTSKPKPSTVSPEFDYMAGDWVLFRRDNEILLGIVSYALEDCVLIAGGVTPNADIIEARR